MIRKAFSWLILAVCAIYLLLPLITQFEQTPAWWEGALHGISPPQNGVGFLKYQGAWYTPFILPNSTGHYDIRGFHAVKGRKE